MTFGGFENFAFRFVRWPLSGTPANMLRIGQMFWYQALLRCRCLTSDVGVGDIVKPQEKG